MRTRTPGRRSAIAPSRASTHVSDDRASTGTAVPAGRDIFSEPVWRDLAGALRLSGRESQIVQAVFDDRKESAIAADLGISTHTVHSHLERLYRKLHVSSRVALVVRVIVEYLSLVEQSGRRRASPP